MCFSSSQTHNPRPPLLPAACPSFVPTMAYPLEHYLSPHTGTPDIATWNDDDMNNPNPRAQASSLVLPSLSSSPAASVDNVNWIADSPDPTLQAMYSPQLGRHPAKSEFTAAPMVSLAQLVQHGHADRIDDGRCHAIVKTTGLRCKNRSQASTLSCRIPAHIAQIEGVTGSSLRSLTTQDPIISTTAAALISTTPGSRNLHPCEMVPSPRSSRSDPNRPLSSSSLNLHPRLQSTEKIPRRDPPSGQGSGVLRGRSDAGFYMTRINGEAEDRRHERQENGTRSTESKERKRNGMPQPSSHGNIRCSTTDAIAELVKLIAGGLQGVDGSRSSPVTLCFANDEVSFELRIKHTSHTQGDTDAMAHSTWLSECNSESLDRHFPSRSSSDNSGCWKDSAQQSPSPSVRSFRDTSTMSSFFLHILFIFVLTRLSYHKNSADAMFAGKERSLKSHCISSSNNIRRRTYSQSLGRWRSTRYNGPWPPKLSKQSDQ